MPEYGVTAQGFVPKTYEVLFKEVESSLRTRLGVNLTKEPDDVLDVITNIILLALSQAWGVNQNIQTAFDIDSAEGKHLDDGVSWAGVERQKGAPTSGYIYIETKGEVFIPAGKEFSDNSGHSFFNLYDLPIDLEHCTYAKIKLDAPLVSKPSLGLNLNGITYSFIIDNEVNTIAAAASYFNDIQAGATVTLIIEEGDYFFLIESFDPNVIISIKTTTNLVPVGLKSFGLIYYEDIGDNTFSANTIVNSPFDGEIVSVTNRDPFTGGRENEEDVELRTRYKASLNRLGKSTVPAVRAALLGVAGVTSAIVMENDTMFTDINGLPPKSLRAVVKGGLDKDIAEVLYFVKGGGIELTGTSSYVITNSEKEPVFIPFSRPELLYVYILISYTVYEGEVFALDTEAKITELVVDYGNKLKPGDDILPSRLSSYITSNVTGLDKVQVKVGATKTEGIGSPYLQSSIFKVSKTQEAILSADRIQVGKVPDDWDDQEDWVDPEYWVELPTD